MKAEEKAFPVMQLDIIRGAAALLVFASHAVEISLDATVVRDGTRPGTLACILLSSVGYGAFWVWGFFIISGLCIHRSILKDISGGAFSWKHYAAARITRVYPLYMVGLVCALITGWIIAIRRGRAWDLPWDSFIGNLLMVQAYTKPVPFFGPSWSLTCEMIYYVAWPLILYLCGWKTWRALALAVMTCLCMSHFIFVVQGDVDSITASVCVYAILWLTGAWLAVVWARLAPQISRIGWLWGGVLLAASYIGVVAGNYYEWGPVAKTWISTSSIPGWILLIGGSRHFDVPAESSRAVWAARLGLLSYPCYILHRPLLAAAAALLPTAIFLDSWIGAGARFAASVLPGLIIILTAGVALETAVMQRRQQWLNRFRQPR